MIIKIDNKKVVRVSLLVQIQFETRGNLEIVSSFFYQYNKVFLFSNIAVFYRWRYKMTFNQKFLKILE